MGFISDWGEAIILSVAFIGALALVVAGMNSIYGKNNELPIADNSTLASFSTYQGTAQESVTGGEVNLDSQNGLSLKSSYSIMTGFINICWNFLSGGWIAKVADMLYLGAPLKPLTIGLQVIWFVSLIFGLLYILFKVKP